MRSRSIVLGLLLGLTFSSNGLFVGTSAYAYPSSTMLEQIAGAQASYIAPNLFVLDSDPLAVSVSISEPILGLGAVSVAALVAQPAHRTVAADPWEKLNRFTFKLNDTTDKLLFKPIAKGYRKVTTKKIRRAMRNFLEHINTPVVFVNDILQGQVDRAAETAGRFVINTTLGFGGVADPAARLGIPDHSEDFGQTMAVWGIPSGPYVVLPLFGPSTVRDGFGLAIDSTVLSPLNYVRTGAAQKARLSRAGVSLLAQREPLIEPLEDIENNSLDFYSSFRSFYLQARRREILNGETILEDLPELDEFDDFDELEVDSEDAL